MFQLRTGGSGLSKFFSTSARSIFYYVITTSLLCNSFFSQAVPTPSPELGKTPVVSKPAGRSLEDLQADIRGRLFRPELNRGQIGIKVVSLNTGKVVFEQNSEKYFMPASNMKNFTVATALEKLTPDFRFVTSVYASAMPDATGTIKGDLRIYGRGDVSISTAFNSTAGVSVPITTPAATPTATPTSTPGISVTPRTVPSSTPSISVQTNPDAVYYQGIDRLIEKIVAAGVKRIEGSIIGDDSYFKGYPIPDGWEWDDLQSYYGAEVSALPINDNAVDLSIKPGPSGYSCSVKLTPYNPVYRIKNLCMTTAAGTQRTLRVEKLLGQNQLEVTGNLPVGNDGFTGSIAVSRPAELFAVLLKQRLVQKGVAVTGQHRASLLSLNTVAPAESIEIAKLESPPLSLIAAKTMKPSQNMYTETLLWTLGEEARKLILVAPNAPRPDSATLGRAEVKNFLTSIGIAEDGIIQYDGSGLSRHNLITPSAVVQLYTYMAKQSKFAQAWRDSLTIGGVDGTLAKRFRGTSAQGNIRGKTGTIDQVSALSGYMTTAEGDQLVVSFVVNGVVLNSNRIGLIDDIVLMLAKFNGKID